MATDSSLAIASWAMEFLGLKSKFSCKKNPIICQEIGFCIFFLLLVFFFFKTDVREQHRRDSTGWKVSLKLMQRRTGHWPKGWRLSQKSFLGKWFTHTHTHTNNLVGFHSPLCYDMHIDKCLLIFLQWKSNPKVWTHSYLGYSCSLFSNSVLDMWIFPPH